MGTLVKSLLLTLLVFLCSCSSVRPVSRYTPKSEMLLDDVLNIRAKGILIEEIIELKNVSSDLGISLDEVLNIRNSEKNRIEKALFEKEKRQKTKLAQEKIRSILSKNLNVDINCFELIDKNNRSIPSEVKNEVYIRDEGVCNCCGSNSNLEYDHILPFSKGGSNTAQNIQLLCLQCNRTKHNKII